MATLKYIGQASPTPQKTTIAVTGVSAAADEYWIQCGGKRLTVTVGTDVSTADICDILARMVNGDAVKFDEVRSATGRDEGFGPFRDFVASYDESTAVLMLTSTWVSGSGYWPFTVTVGETTAGSGALGTPTQDGSGTSQVCDGPSHFSAGANYDTGSAPANSDTVIWDHGDYKVLHDLNNTATSLTIEVKDSYAGEWGLDAINTNWAGYHYPEYRQPLLDLPSSGSSHLLYIGERNSGVVPKFKLRFDLGAVASSSLVVRQYNAPEMRNGEYAVQISGGEPMQFIHYGGSVILGPDEKENAPELKTLLLRGNSGTVRITDHVTLDSSMGASQQNGGTLYFDSGAGDNLDLTMYGGEAYYTSSSVNYGNIVVYGGGTFYSGAGGNSATVHNGGKFITTDLASAPDNVYLYGGYYYEDEYGDLPTNGFDFIGCAPGPNFKVRDNLTWTPSAI